MIAARLDGLPQAERRVVQDASVLGKTFTKQSVAALTELPEADLERLLSSLTRKEIFGVQADPRSPEHGQYGFLQDLLRKVAYETLAKADRKARHLAAAAYLERTLGEQEVVEVVASHYLDAYRVAPDAADAGEIRATAGERLAGAGVRAASLGANEEAERYFAQAAELADDPLAKATLEEQAGRIAWRGLRPVEARVYLGRALAAFEAADAATAGAGLGHRGRDRLPRRTPLRGGRPTRDGARHARGRRAGRDLAYAAAQLGRFLVLNNQSEEGAPRLELALELAEALRLPEVFCQALTARQSHTSIRTGSRRAASSSRGRSNAPWPTICTQLRLAPSTTWRSTTSPPTVTEEASMSPPRARLARRFARRLSKDFVFGPLGHLVLLRKSN